MLSVHIKFFWKIIRGLELVFLPHFQYSFWRKIFLLLCSINWPNFIVWLPLLCEILDNMSIANVCIAGCDVINFEVNLIFLIKPFFLNNQNVVQNLKTKSKIFFIIFKGLSVKQIIQIGRWEPDFNIFFSIFKLIYFLIIVVLLFSINYIFFAPG